MHGCNSSPKTAAYTTHLPLHQFRYQMLDIVVIVLFAKPVNADD
jgi:hypothetical protein